MAASILLRNGCFSFICPLFFCMIVIILPSGMFIVTVDFLQNAVKKASDNAFNFVEAIGKKIYDFLS